MQLLHTAMYRLYFFFFNDTATTEIYTLSLHDALPIWLARKAKANAERRAQLERFIEKNRAKARKSSQAKSKQKLLDRMEDRKSTRLNSSHANISYAVFCLKKKKHKSTIYIASVS